MNLNKIDPMINEIILKEKNRQEQHIELIASENFVSDAVLEAQGSILTNKYAEGYPKKRYYGGCEFVDEIETLAIERLKKLFNAKFANVQPHSGSSANAAAFLAMLQPNDIIYVAERPIISFSRLLAEITPLRTLLRDIDEGNLP